MQPLIEPSIFSHFSAEPSFKALPYSAPYCVYRNRERYTVSWDEGVAGAQGPHRRYFDNMHADDQVRLYADSLAEAPLPTRWLFGTLKRDTLDLQVAPPHRSTLACLTHAGRSMFAHTSGAHLDELVLRDTLHCHAAGLGLKNPPGFSLPLTRGAPILQLHSVGGSHWGTRANLLASTRYELLHVRTMGLDELRARPGEDGTTGKDEFRGMTQQQKQQQW
mmetsp:Transcript_5313/g.12135  ORF Transcript_5313/g.12135 Transcript_5313/m.12135 type:complete len:220 (-) Transcript_5313:28-687(-)